MTKLATIFLTALILLGITSYGIKGGEGNTGINQELLNGYGRLANEVRSYNFSTN